MGKSKVPKTLHSEDETPADIVFFLADAVGMPKVTMSDVAADLLKIVPDPILAGGFAMAHHGHIRGTIDFDVIVVAPIRSMIEQFVSLGYKHESIRLDIGDLDLLTKGNKGVDFIRLENEAFQKAIEKRAVSGWLYKKQVRYVSLEDMILLKSLAVKGRTGRWDQGDLSALLEKPYDKTYVERWKPILGLT